MGNPSERAIKLLGDFYIACGTCGKSKHVGDLYVIDCWPICVDCVDKADDAARAARSARRAALVAWQTESAEYAGKAYCADCMVEFDGSDRWTCPSCGSPA